MPRSSRLESVKVAAGIVGALALAVGGVISINAPSNAPAPYQLTSTGGGEEDATSTTTPPPSRQSCVYLKRYRMEDYYDLPDEPARSPQ